MKSNETASTSTSATSFIPMSSTTPTSTPTSETASSDTGALTTGAKVGTGVGVSVAGLAVLSALAFVLFQRQLRSSPQEMTGSRDQAPDGSSYMKPQPAPQELFAPPPEIESTTNTRREMMRWYTVDIILWEYLMPASPTRICRTSAACFAKRIYL